MTNLLLWKEHLKRFYNRYSYGMQPVVHFLFALYAVVNLNTNIGYMTKLRSPLVTPPVCLISTFLPYGAIVFLAGCLMIAHVYTVSLEMVLIATVLILIIVILYHGSKPGDSYLIALILLALLPKILYVVPLPIELGGSPASVIPVGCGMLLYYLLIYVKQDADILVASGGSVDIVQKCSQAPKSMFLNQTMMVVIATCAVGIIVAYLIRRLSMDYVWVVVIMTGSVAELLAIFMKDFVSGAPVSVGPTILGLILSAATAVVFSFFVLSVDYTQTGYAQFESDDYCYYVRAVFKMAMSIPDVEVQKISTHKRGTREGNSY